MEIVVVLHGLIRVSHHMDKLARSLEKNGYKVYNLDYPTTKLPLKELAEFVYHKMEKEFKSNTKVNLVGYSTGAVVCRILATKHRPKNLGKVVQLAPPNHGSEYASFLKNFRLYKAFFGPAGQELTLNNKSTEKLLGKIDYELGVVAGNLSLDPMSLLIFNSPNDGKVSVASTKVNGMKDHITLNASHTFFPRNNKVIGRVLEFLKHGKFSRGKTASH